MIARARLALWNLAVNAYRNGHGRIAREAMIALRAGGMEPPARVAFGG